MTFTTVLAILHSSHEYTSSTLSSTISFQLLIYACDNYLRGRTLSPQALDLAVFVHFVILENSQLRLLALVLDLLGSSVYLLLSLFGPSTKTEDEMKG